jgi:hypothetical protein
MTTGGRCAVHQVPIHVSQLGSAGSLVVGGENERMRIAVGRAACDLLVALAGSLTPTVGAALNTFLESLLAVGIDPSEHR